MSGSPLRQLVKGSFWVLIANLVTRFSGFIVLPIIARLLGTAGLGVYGAIQQTVQVGGGLAKVGMDIVVQRNGAQYQTLGVEQTGRTFGVGGILIVGVGALISLLLILFPNYIAINLLGDPRVEPWLGIAALSIFLTEIATPSWLYLMALQAFRTYSLRTTLVTISSAVLTLILTFKFGLNGALWSLVMGASSQLIVGWWLTLPILRAKNIKLSGDRFVPVAIDMLKLGLPFYASNFISNFVALPFLGYVIKQNGIEQVAYIRIAQSLSQFISFLPYSIAHVLVSILSANLGADQENHTRTKSIHFRGTWLVVTMLTLIICLGLDWIVPVLFGKAYLQSVNLARISIYGTALYSMSGIMNQYLVAEGKTKVIGIVQTLSLGLNIILALVLIPLYQAFGLLLAQAIAAFFTLFFLARPAVKDIFILNTTQVKSIIYLSAIVTLIIFTLPSISAPGWLKLIASMVIDVVVFGLCLWQTFTPKELDTAWIGIKTKLS
jgi:O-antigen/teichoic acid export membrane protein